MIKELLYLRPGETATKKPAKRATQPKPAKKQRHSNPADYDDPDPDAGEEEGAGKKKGKGKGKDKDVYDEDANEENGQEMDKDDPNNPENVADFNKAYAKVKRAYAKGSW